MRYAKSIALSGAVAVAWLWLSLGADAGPPPATTPAAAETQAHAAVKLRESIVQHVVPEDSDPAINILESKEKPPASGKVIVISPPKEYLDWLHERTGLDAFEQFRIEAMPTTHQVIVAASAMGKDAKAKLKITLLESFNTGPDIDGNHCELSGVIQVDAGSDHRFAFPYKCESEYSRGLPPGDIPPPTGATITWQRPEAYSLASSPAAHAIHPAASQPTDNVPEAISQSVEAQDSSAMVETPGAPRNAPPPPPEKVIVISAPIQYIDWFRVQSDFNPFDSLRIEAQPFSNDVLVMQSGAGGFYANVDNPILGRVVDIGYEVISFRTDRRSRVNFDKTCAISGVIQIDVKPNRRRFDFPYKAAIQLGDMMPMRDYRAPASAEISWQKPEVWKKDN